MHIATPLHHLCSFQSSEAVLERVTEAADAADLLPEEQDRVEAALGGATEGDGPLEAAVQLLVMGSPMARIAQVASLDL